MAYQVFFSDQAQQDIQKAYNWYELQQLGLGERFYHSIELSVSLIKTSPFTYPQKHKHTHEIVLKTFPFIFIYLIEDKNIFVQAVFAALQHPNKKYRVRK